MNKQKKRAVSPLFAVLGAAFLILDQWVKWWTVNAFSAPTENLYATSDPAKALLPGLVELTRVHNYGAAWSSFSGSRWLLVGVTCIIVIAVAVLLVKEDIRHPLGLTAGSLIMAGGLGNIIDRVRLGYVVDMFHFEFWPSYPVFNVADICIVCGAVLGVIYYLWFYEKYDKRGGEDGQDHAPNR